MNSNNLKRPACQSLGVVRRALPTFNWVFIGFLFSILIALFVVVSFETITLIVKGWFTYSASHGSLMFLVSVFIVWRKRKYLGQIKPQPSIILGTVLTGLGCLILISGRLSITGSLEKISFIVLLLGLVLLLGGWSYLKVLYVPICYLIFTMSVFDTILSGQLIYFQRIAAYIAANVLILLGLPVFRSGQTITLPHITLDVATACSGINHILALVGLAIPLAFVTQRTRWRKIVLVLEAFFIGILANGLRVAAIGLWTHINKSASVHGPLDIFLVSFIFGFGLVALIILSIVQGRISLKRIAARSIEAKVPQMEQTSRQAYSGLVAGAVILGLTGGYLLFHTIEPLHLSPDLREIPKVIGSWVGEDVYGGAVNSAEIHPDSELSRTYRNPNGDRIHVYVGYFSKQSKENKVFNSEYSSFKANSKPIQLVKESNVVLTLNHKKNKRGDIYFGYVINGDLVSSPYIAKLAMIKNAFLKGKSNAGVVIIEAECNSFSPNTTEKVTQALDLIKNIVLRIVTEISTPEGTV